MFLSISSSSSASSCTVTQIKFSTRCPLFLHMYNLYVWNHMYLSNERFIFLHHQLKQLIGMGNCLQMFFSVLFLSCLYRFHAVAVAVTVFSSSAKNATNIIIIFLFSMVKYFQFSIPHYYSLCYVVNLAFYFLSVFIYVK